MSKEPITIMSSILLSVKKLLGIEEDHISFDTDIIIFINSALATLNQIGIGPPLGYAITSEIEPWDEIVGPGVYFEDVKTFVYLKVRLVFDPPTNAFLVKAIEDQIQELTWRLNVKGGAKL